MTNANSQLRLNVGFLINQNIGYSREFIFDIPHIHLKPDLDLKDLAGSARITRTPQGLLVQVKMHALADVECVRCLKEFQQPLDIDFTELYAFSPRTTSESGLLLPEDMHIDLEPLAREYMILNLPISPVCTPDCKGLCPICGEILDENHVEHIEEDVDPRLAVLKKLLDQPDQEQSSSS